MVFVLIADRSMPALGGRDGLSVVGDIPDRGSGLLRGKRIDHRTEQMVGIEDGIVVGIDVEAVAHCLFVVDVVRAEAVELLGEIVVVEMRATQLEHHKQFVVLPSQCIHMPNHLGIGAGIAGLVHALVEVGAGGRIEQAALHNGRGETILLEDLQDASFLVAERMLIGCGAGDD